MVHSIDVRTSQRSEFIDITKKIENAVQKAHISDGACRIFVPHTTAGLTINENADPSVRKDILNTLNKLIPRDSNYSHSEGNSDAHIKSSILGNTKTLLIENGHLKLGTWQGIFFCEFDGPRKREVWVKIEGEKDASKKI